MTHGPAIFDESVLADLRRSVGDDDAFVADLVETYLSDGRDQIAAMDTAWGATDVANVVRPAHTLKSSSASLGALRLSEVCRALEAAARDGRDEDVKIGLSAVHELWEPTVSALKAWKPAP